eukprot:g17110.t1
MAGVVKASAQVQADPVELRGFPSCHPFYTAIPRKKHKATATKSKQNQRKTLSIDDDKEEDDEEEEEDDDQLGAETVFDNQNDRGPDLIRDAACCLQVTLPSRFLTRPTPLGSGEDNGITSAFNALAALWWAIATHPKLRGGSGGLPHKILAVSALLDKDKQTIGHALWLWINAPDFDLCRYVNKLLKHRGAYETPPNGIDSDSDDEAGDDTNVANQDPEEKHSKARPAKAFEKKKKKVSTRPAFTKDPHVLTYRRHLARACETLERYANAVSVRALGMQEELLECLHDSAGSNRITEGGFSRRGGIARTGAAGRVLAQLIVCDTVEKANEEAKRLALQMRPTSTGGGANQEAVKRMMRDGRAKIKAEVAMMQARGASREECCVHSWTSLQQLRRRVEPLVLNTLNVAGGCSDAQAAAWNHLKKGRKSPFSGAKLPPSFYSYQALPASNLGIADCQLVRLNSLLEAVYRGPLNEEFHVALASAQTAGAVGTYFHLMMYGPPGTGKSHLHKLLADHFLIRDSVRAQLGMSAKALAGNFDFTGAITIMDELGKGYRGNPRGDQEDDDRVEMVKSMLWSKTMGFSFLRTDQDTGQRFNEYTQAQVTGTHLVNTNTHPSRISQPVRDRFHTRYVPGRVRAGCEAWHSFSNDDGDEEAEARRHDLARWVRDNNALIAMYYYLQSLGFVGGVRLYITSRVMGEFCERASALGVRRLASQRFMHRLNAMVRLLALRRAIEIVFHSSASPLIDANVGTDHGFPLGRAPALSQFALLEPFLNDEDPSVLMQAIGLLAPQELQLQQQRQVLFALARAFLKGNGSGGNGGNGGDMRGLHRAQERPRKRQHVHADGDEDGTAEAAEGGEDEDDDFLARAWEPPETMLDYKSPYLEFNQSLAVDADAETVSRYYANCVRSRRLFQAHEGRIENARKESAVRRGMYGEGEQPVFRFAKDAKHFPEPTDYVACRKKLLQLVWQNRAKGEGQDQQEYRHVLDLLLDDSERPSSGAVLRQTRDCFEIAEQALLYGLWPDLLQRVLLEILQDCYARPRQLLTGQVDHGSASYNLTMMNLLPTVLNGATAPLPTTEDDAWLPAVQQPLCQDPVALSYFLRERALSAKAPAADGQGARDFADYVYQQHHASQWLPTVADGLPAAEKFLTAPDAELLRRLRAADETYRRDNLAALGRHAAFAEVAARLQPTVAAYPVPAPAPPGCDDLVAVADEDG